MCFNGCAQESPETEPFPKYWYQPQRNQKIIAKNSRNTKEGSRGRQRQQSQHGIPQGNNMKKPGREFYSPMALAWH